MEKTGTTWMAKLLRDLEKRTGRSDIEVTVNPNQVYDALILRAADKHPIVNFYAGIEGNAARLTAALDYAVSFLENWEVSQVQHDKMKRDCLPFYEELKVEFPHLELVYNAGDFPTHVVTLTKGDGLITAAFDLWPRMASRDVGRIADFIREMEETLERENAESGGVTYWWNQKAQES